MSTTTSKSFVIQVGIGYFAAVENSIVNLSSHVMVVMPSGLRTIVAAEASSKPPHHLLLGNDAFEGAIDKIHHLRQDFAAVEWSMQSRVPLTYRSRQPAPRLKLQPSHRSTA